MENSVKMIYSLTICLGDLFMDDAVDYKECHCLSETTRHTCDKNFLKGKKSNLGLKVHFFCVVLWAMRIF